jgi:hypothetical protein
MIESLADLLSDFPGAANRTRCFTHILNLVAKCIMKQFDAPKFKKRHLQDDDVANFDGETSDDEDLEGLQVALHELEDEVEDEDEESVENERAADEEIDELRKGMTAKEIKDLERCIKPMRLVLTKVNRLSNCHVTLQLTRFSCARPPTPSKTHRQ